MPDRDNTRGRGDGNNRLSPIARELNPEHQPIGEGQRFPRSISGGSFYAGEPIKQYAMGRICHMEGCETKLSRYNPGPGCSEHPATKMVERTAKVIRIDSKKVRKSVKKKVQKRTKK